MDMNYLVQRRINAQKKYRKKVTITIALSVLLLVLIVVGLIKVIMDENAVKAGNGTQKQQGENSTEISPVPTLTPTFTPTPTPTPIPKKKVALDPGHGGTKDFGSSRLSEDLHEKNANLAIALFLKEELEARGYDVFMTRDTDVAVKNETRVAMAKENEADIYVSIHLNSYHEDNDSIRGAEALYSDLFNKDSEVLAQCVVDELSIVTNTRNRGIKLRNDLVVLNRNELPACLIECGFMSSVTECANLFDSEYQKLIAQGIANGIEKFLPTE